jgi:hypothetical protein
LFTFLTAPYYTLSGDDVELKIQIFGRIFSLCIGHKTQWFAQTYLLTIEEQFYSDQNYPFEITYAKMIWRF